MGFIQKNTNLLVKLLGSDENDMSTEKVLKLKVGAQIMMVKNDQEMYKRWVNGALVCSQDPRQQNICKTK